MRASDTAALHIEGARVPKENLLGKLHGAFNNVLRILQGGRIGIGAMAVGIARGAFEEALKYAKERKQFGKFIAEFEAIQWMLADMATEIDAARLLVQRAAHLKDAGQPFPRLLPRPNYMPRKPPCAPPPRQSRFTADMGISKIIRWRDIFVMPSSARSAKELRRCRE